MWKDTHSNIKISGITKFQAYQRYFLNNKGSAMLKFYQGQSFTSTKDVLQCQKCLAIPRELLKQTQIDVIIMHTNREGPICVLGKYDDLLT